MSRKADESAGLRKRPKVFDWRSVRAMPTSWLRLPSECRDKKPSTKLDFGLVSLLSRSASNCNFLRTNKFFDEILKWSFNAQPCEMFWLISKCTVSIKDCFRSQKHTLSLYQINETIFFVSQVSKECFQFPRNQRILFIFSNFVFAQRSKGATKGLYFLCHETKGFFPAKFGIAMGSHTFAFDTDDSYW